MTIDERLEAITMNLELASRDIQDLRDATRANTLEGAAQRERIDILVTSVTSLLTVSQAHEARLQRLERKSA